MRVAVLPSSLAAEALGGQRLGPVRIILPKRCAELPEYGALRIHRLVGHPKEDQPAPM